MSVEWVLLRNHAYFAFFCAPYKVRISGAMRTHSIACAAERGTQGSRETSQKFNAINNPINLSIISLVIKMRGLVVNQNTCLVKGGNKVMVLLWLLRMKIYLISTGGYTQETKRKTCNEKEKGIAFNMWLLWLM